MDGPYVYLIVQREFIRLHEPVVKPGQSGNVRARVTSYPNGSTCLATTPVIDRKAAETALLTAFKAAFKHRTDIGAEYFLPPGDYETACRSAVALYTTRSGGWDTQRLP